MSHSITIAYIDSSRQRQLYTALPDDTVIIGNSHLATIQQNHRSVSSNHCRIRFSKTYTQWIVEDCGSTTGTYLNGEKINKGRALSSNDRVRLGKDGPIISVGLKTSSQIGTSLGSASSTPFAPSYNSQASLPNAKEGRKSTLLLTLSASVAVVTAVVAVALRSFYPGAQLVSSPPKVEHQASSERVLCSGALFDTEDLYKLVKPSVVQVTTQSGTGSGVILESNDDQSIILTNQHVVEGYDTVTLLYPENESSSGSVVKLGGQQQLKDDLALISTSRSNLKYAKVSTQLSVGQTVFVIGSPGLGGDTGAVLQWSLTKGIISNLDPAGEPGIFQTDAGINPGNSGGPVFDSQGCLVGLAVAVPSDRTIQQVGFGITSESINTFLSR